MDAVGLLEVRWAQGFTYPKVDFVDNKVVCYACGNRMIFLNIETKTQSVYQPPSRGIGAFAANGNFKILAFSEHRSNPSIFVLNYPELELQNELKGTAQLDYTSLALSDGGPYLGCCSSLPDHTITVWNWKSAEPICRQAKAGKDVITLVFNPMSWQQICVLGATTVTVWDIEKSDSFHTMKQSAIDLPATDGSFVEKEVHPFHAVNGRLTYLGPQMPPSAIAGLTRDRAENFVPQRCIKARLTPSAICWTATSELYVGCKEGFLLLVDPESLSVSVLFNPRGTCTSAATSATPELKKGSFESLVLHGDGLIAAREENVIHCLHIKRAQIGITQTWNLEEPVTTVMYSPDYETLILASNKGQIYSYKPTHGKMDKVLDILSGNFVAGASLCIDENVCVSVRESGELQLWSTDGCRIGSLSLQAKVSSLACCPIAHYAVAGTVSGHVLFIELIKKHQPRLVHKIHLYHGPVAHLIFDQEGNYLFTGASESHIYLLDTRPSKRFSVIGYTVVPGSVLSLSTQYNRVNKQVGVLALCTGQKDKEQEGSLLTLLTLPVRDLTGPAYSNQHGCLSDDILLQSMFEVPHALKSCVLGVNEFFAYCHRRRAIQRFQLPQDTDCFSGQGVLQLRPEQEVKGHPLGPVSFALSPHQSWLASVGQDGLLRLRETISMEQYIEIQCHSYCHGGVRSVSFSADSQMLFTTGHKDGSLVCANLRIKLTDAGQGNKATQYSQSMASFLRNTSKEEDLVLSDLPDFDQRFSPPTCTTHPQEEETTDRRETKDVTGQDEGYTNVLSATASDPTWLESKQEEVKKAEGQQYSQKKEDLKKCFKELCKAIQEMMRENENLPDIERLELWEFNLDVEEQKKMDAEVEQEVTRVRNEIEMEILAKSYLRDVQQRECWDSMNVKGKAIKAFHSEDEVKNYPMGEQTKKMQEDLHRVQSIRQTEKADSITQQEVLEKSSKAVGENEEEEEEGCETESATLMGGLSAQLGCSNPNLYDQFSLNTREQKINQIILLQDVVFQVKMAFNTKFEAVYEQKQQEINRVKDKNKRIKEIMMKLDISEQLWEPSLSDNEQPEKTLTVEESEIKVEKYLTPEQRKKEERKKLDEQILLDAKGYNTRERALDDMMGGVLEMMKEDILKMEIPQPEFVLIKPETQWSEEEKKIYKQYEKKTNELREEQEKCRKMLETEMKKLQASIKEATERFDETLTKLFERKVKSEMAIHQEEFKIASLEYSILIEEEIINQEAQLSLKLEEKRAHKKEIGEVLMKHRENVEVFQAAYENAVTEDKCLDKKFRKEFTDVPHHVVSLLYKLYKRRPRLQRMRTLTDNTISPVKEPSLCGLATADGLDQTLKAMEELDSPKNMPKGLEPSIWERFRSVRRTKIESEQKVKMKALTLAEMQTFLQKRTNEDELAEKEIKNLIDELHGLREEKIRFQQDIMVHIQLKQGQVEVVPTDFIADYSDAVLLHRSVVEDLNKTVKMLGEQKIAIMMETKEICKSIIQQDWENKRLRMQIEDLETRARDIQKLHVTKKLREYLSERDHDKRMANQVAALEKKKALQEKIHLKNVQQRKKMIKQLNRQEAVKAEKIAILDQRIADKQVTVAEKKQIYKATAAEKNQEAKAKQRYREILQKKKLVDQARAQAEDLALLRAEVERWRMKTFPALYQLNHN
ncbi:cilia- and flagella-associated protein 43 [Lampris incognitus]|uniref:cilia- and flagella-associated protein 43 n=1 Tax=Lampris incognitus TaxID=2546036 RepID=UPI0024B5B3F9|nr:cilia- and flagella-associated protein 43 [Lampris incognitus]